MSKKMEQAFLRRSRAVHQKSEEMTRWKQLSPTMMSDESSGDEENTITVHKPVWRSKSASYIHITCYLK